MIHIDDPDDPAIAAYRGVKERDLVGRQGHFIAEGEVVVRQLLSSDRFDTVSLLLAEKRADKLAPLAADLRPDAPVYVAAQPVIDAIAGFHLHRGVLALGRQPEPVEADVLLAGLAHEAIVLALFGIGNHDNIGGLFRNAAAFGAAAVVLDAGCCDPLYRKAIRVSVGAALRIPFARLRAADDPIGLLQHHGFEAIALSPKGAERLCDLRPTGRTAALLGTEGPGLPPAILSRCCTVRIPMAPGFDSLNVATACGVVLHHLTSMRNGAAGPCQRQGPLL
jgi:tRNA G18 (ribose-2'-O)-methylase SpoU